MCELLIASQSAGKLRVSVIAKAMCLPGPQIQVSVGFKDIWQKAPIAHLNTQYSVYNFMSEKGFRQGNAI